MNGRIIISRDPSNEKKKRLVLGWSLILAIGLMSRVLVKGPEDHGSIPGRVVPKT